MAGPTRSQPWLRIAAVAACLASLALGGCATAVRGTTQRISVVTDPPGAECLLKNRGMDAPALIAATPGEAEIARARTGLTVSCSAHGFVDHEDQVRAVSASEADDESQRRSILAAGVAMYSIHTATTAAAFTAAMGAVGAGVTVAVAPLALAGLFAILPVSLAVDMASGAFAGYPTVILVELTPARFPSEAARVAYVSERRARMDRAEQALRARTEAGCGMFCGAQREKDEEDIAQQRRIFAAAIAKSRIEPPP